MTQQTRADIIRHFRKPYGRASKAEKSRMLNVAIESSGYSPKRGIALLTGGRAEKEAYTLSLAGLCPSVRYAGKYVGRIILPVR